MTLRIGNLKRLASVAALGATLMGFAGCGAEDAANGVCDGLDASKVQCSAKGVVDGNFAISGNVAIDSFFKSVVNFGNTASQVSADIKAEVDGIRLAFGVSDADLKAASGDVGAAVKAKLDTQFKAKIAVDYQAPKCEVDAQVTAQATLDCQASANCDVSGGKASVQCMGTCTVEASAEGKCDAMAELKCEVSGPQVACQGSCEGSCTAQLDVAAACNGTCNGECMGTCSAMNGDGSCAGTCDGMCKGSCELSGDAALNCQGTCNGSCKATPPSGSCDANAKVSCEFKAEAKAECSGSCDGEFEPPKVDCDASASCEASAKADAKFSAKCEPPSLDVKVTATGTIDADAQAQLDFALGELKLRLPRLLAALKKADLVVDAGTQLTGDGKAAVDGTIKALSDVKTTADISAAVKIGKCVPDQLKASAGVINTSGEKLAAQVAAAGSLTGALGVK
jgi:hypothetical protein